MQATLQAENFWSETYRGRVIAIMNHCGRWLIYLDHVLQPRMQFETPEAAVAWLQQKVDRPKVRARFNRRF